ncbi:hypothetical protein BN1723_001894 [Verticillium longisporum]|uniref:DNA sliding clamp PCNA n=1 Tax=Verticillium longisporum TaxID=100787 RepID=A0A0G4KSK5_VERLO|nr:hypothetical protein BN1723_001894 [Verticillium longisporum]
MLEAKLEQADILKKVVDAIKDLVQDCNFDCNDSGIALQAMDNSHVALVSMMLKAEAFSPYRCDRNIALGVNLTSLTKVLRAANSTDQLTLKAEDAPDSLSLTFENGQDRFSEYDLKLMDIDQEHLGIPDTDYAATITLPSNEFRRICVDLSAMSESVTIEANKDGVAASRFHTMRKMALCALLALDASGDSSDLMRWTTAVEALRALNLSTSSSFERLKTILSEQECK